MEKSLQVDTGYRRLIQPLQVLNSSSIPIDANLKHPSRRGGEYSIFRRVSRIWK